MTQILLPRLFTYDWLQLPNEVRLKLVEIFKIPRSGGAVIEDNRVITDGYTQIDLDTITTLAMQAYLDTDETDFAILFKAVLKKIEPELVPPKLHTETQAPVNIKISINEKEYELKETQETKESSDERGTESKGGGSEAPARPRKGKGISHPPQA